MSKPAVDIYTLSREERLDLLEQLWDSLSDQSTTLPLTEEQQTELDRRLDALDREGPIGLSPDDVRKRVLRQSP